MRVTNFGKKIKYSVESESDQKRKKMRKEKNENREAALAHTTIYVNVDKVGQTPHNGMNIGTPFLKEHSYLHTIFHNLFSHK